MGINRPPPGTTLVLEIPQKPSFSPPVRPGSRCSCKSTAAPASTYRGPDCPHLPRAQTEPPRTHFMEQAAQGRKGHEVPNSGCETRAPASFYSTPPRDGQRALDQALQGCRSSQTQIKPLLHVNSTARSRACLLAVNWTLPTSPDRQGRQQILSLHSMAADPRRRQLSASTCQLLPGPALSSALLLPFSCTWGMGRHRWDSSPLPAPRLAVPRAARLQATPLHSGLPD